MSNDTIRECHAYSQSGQKCSHPAGHPGDHAIIITWGDDECWTPGTEQVRPMASRAMGVADGLVPPQPVDEPVYVPSGKCAICQHKHHPHGLCGAPEDGDFTCDCMTSIED
jgi:hypothetical protein